MSPTANDWRAPFVGAPREVYRRALLELASHDPRIYCLDSDTGGLEDTFASSLPRQYVDVGIAEANLVSVAAGLAATGKIPFVNTMASFASTRACEQVKIDVAYTNLPVKIVATHAGLSGGHFGPTHHALEDVAIMRALPNMTVFVPADGIELARAVAVAAALPGPVYIRLGRKATDLVHTHDYQFTPGKAFTLREGTDVTIVCAGAYPLLRALEAHDRLAGLGISARVLNAATLKPLDREAMVAAARETRGLVTVEDHSVIGGLGSAVAELVAECAPTWVYRIGVPDTFCDRVGSHVELLDEYGIDVKSIVQSACRLVSDQLYVPGTRDHRLTGRAMVVST